jgi:hypothetical protein
MTVSTRSVGQIRADRLGTIRRAIDLIDAASLADLAVYLGRTRLHDHVKADPAMLRHHLATVGDTGNVFSAWKAAQQILQAAGLPT